MSCSRQHLQARLVPGTWAGTGDQQHRGQSWRAINQSQLPLDQAQDRANTALPGSEIAD